jgi:hypothetical protein
MRSFQDADGNNFIGTCYQGFMDGSEFCCFYDRSDYDVCSVVVWAEIRKNKKVFTGNNRQRALMKVLYPKKQQIKLTTKKTIIATACTNYAKLLRIIEIRQT